MTSRHSVNHNYEMNKAYFLITDVDVLDGSHQLLHRLSIPERNTIVYAIVPDFQTLRNLRGEFPFVNFLYLDLANSVNVNKEVLSCLPELDCIVNYSGDLLADSLHRVRDIKISKAPCIDVDAVSVRAIYKLMEESKDEVGTLVINVQKMEKYGCSGAEAFAKLKKKENYRRSEEESECDIFFHPGRRFIIPPPAKLSTSTSTTTSTSTSATLPRKSIMSIKMNPVRISRLLQESQPLLDPRPQLPSPGISSWVSTLFFCCCYPSCFTKNLGEISPRFKYQQEIRNFTRGEQHLVLRRKLKRLMDNAEGEWYRIMTRIDSDEVLRIEELYVQEMEKKRKDKEELKRLIASQLAHPKARLVLTEGQRARIKASQAIQHPQPSTSTSKSVNFVWDGDREHYEAADEIRREMREIKDLKEAEHYSIWVQKEIMDLRVCKDKCMTKYGRLYFETYKRPVPYD